MPDQVVKRGAMPSPRSALAAAAPYPARIAAPADFIVKPQKISMWGNDVHGDCVTAEEAFAKACHDPEIFLTDAEVIAWATKHDVLEGAYLIDVLTWMQNDGFPGGEVIYDDGAHYSVNWTNPATLHSAIAEGPVKIGVAADQLETAYFSTNGESGWFATGFHRDDNEDHCTTLCGYGSIAWLAQQLGVPVPTGVDGTKPGYAMFTWNSIGIIDAPSMSAITHEAWLRRPTTVTRPVGWVGRWSKLYTDANKLAALAASNDADGRLHVFGLSFLGNVWNTWQKTPNGAWVGHWSQVPGEYVLAALRVGRNKDGRLEVFSVDLRGHVRHTWQKTPGGDWVGQWWELYTDANTLTTVEVANHADGRLVVVGLSAQGSVWHTSQKTPNGDWVGHWSQLPSDDALTMLRVARTKDGRLEVFGLDSQGHIWHTSQKTPNGDWVGHWAELYTDANKLTTLEVAGNADGRLEVVGLDSQGQVWHTWQQADGAWAGHWSHLSGDNDLTTLRVARNKNGGLEAIGLDSQGHIWHTWQKTPGGAWAGRWAELYSDANKLTALEVANNADGRLELVGLSSGGRIWHTWQV